MFRILFFIALILPVCFACTQKDAISDSAPKAKNSKNELTCKLMPEEMRLYKESVLASLKNKIIDKKELPNGYAFKFPGSDSVVDELIGFIKAERECCDFFVFNLSISGDKSEAWLQLTGVEGAKDFITQELGL